MNCAQAAEKLAQTRIALAAVTAQIETYALGDRPSSPPVSLIREERRLRAIAAWYRAACSGAHGQ